MKKEKKTWFGFRITQKQAVIIFILALLGTCILSMTTWSLFYIFFNWIFVPYDYWDLDYFVSMLISMIPYYTLNIVLLILCIYSLIRSRKIAKYYSEIMDNQIHDSKVGLFCPNCGNKSIGAEKFCRKCGEELRRKL